jgi:hypothetical protein
MKLVKRFVCLANSRKLSGRCVAGKEVTSQGVGEWIRPVSGRLGEEISEYDSRCNDGSNISVLDVIDVPMLQAQPQSYQRENWRIDPSLRWRRHGRIAMDQLPQLIDPIAPLWTNGFKTYHGLNDKVPIEQANSLSSSLRLIYTEKLSLLVHTPGKEFGDHTIRVQGRFKLANVHYWLRVTDLAFENAYMSKPQERYELGEAFLTVSLSAPFKGASYKLIAAIFLPSGGAKP